MRWLAMLLLLLPALTPIEAAEPAAQRFASECSAATAATASARRRWCPRSQGSRASMRSRSCSCSARGAPERADDRGGQGHERCRAARLLRSDRRLPPRPPAEESAPDAAKQARGAALAQRLHCTGCHGADLAGGAQVPRLAGQREDYLLHALQGFAPPRASATAAMNETLAGTSPADLEDLAHWLAHVAAPPR
jgi:cytochrome c553